MGGNALKNTYTRRYSKNEYFLLFDEIEKTVSDSDVSEYFKLLPSYKNKQTFGDMDILINSFYFKKDIDFIHEKFKPNELFNNGNTVSFNFKELQIDFIFMSDKYYDTAYTYYSYNDLGNLMGRIANKFGTKYGHKGLFKKTYTEDRCKILDETFLSNNLEKIFDFLGFDYSEYLKGFSELKDIYDYVVNSKFFDKDIFSYENLDHQNRTRNKKRKTYQGFLEYIEDLEIENYKFEKDRNLYLEKIDKYFPEAKIYDKIKKAKENEKRLKKIKEKFNGNLIMKLIDMYDGEKLGKFISYYKSKFSDFDDYILNTNQDDIFDSILYAYYEFKKYYKK